MVSNSNSIVSFSNSGFCQLLTLCDIEGLTFVFLNVENQALRKDYGKGAENLVGQIEHIIEVQDARNTKDKILKNSIGDEHASIDIAIVPKNGFVDEAIEIFTE